MYLKSTVLLEKPLKPGQKAYQRSSVRALRLQSGYHLDLNDSPGQPGHCNGGCRDRHLVASAVLFTELHGIISGIRAFPLLPLAVHLLHARHRFRGKFPGDLRLLSFAAIMTGLEDLDRDRSGVGWLCMGIYTVRPY
jgi:hypothetical protein